MFAKLVNIQNTTRSVVQSLLLIQFGLINTTAVINTEILLHTLNYVNK